METTPQHEYSGARALVLLHEHHLRSFLATWRRAREAGVGLPTTDDPAYDSLDALLAHVCSAARGYMVWACEVLGLPDPEIRPRPEPAEIATAAEEYIEHLLERWRTPLSGVPEESFHRPEHESRWRVRYCVDAMLEHAVMHPIRHEFQLAALLEE